MQPPAGLDRRLAPELTKADQPTCRIVLEKPVLAHDVVGGEEQRRAVCLGDDPYVVPIQVCDHAPPNCHRIKLFGAQLRADVTWPGCGNRRKPPLYPWDMDACGKARVDQDGSLWVFNDIAQDRKLEVLARAKQGREPLTSPKGLVPNQGTGLNCVRLHPGAS